MTMWEFFLHTWQGVVTAVLVLMGVAAGVYGVATIVLILNEGRRNRS